MAGGAVEDLVVGTQCYYFTPVVEDALSNSQPGFAAAEGGFKFFVGVKKGAEQGPLWDFASSFYARRALIRPKMAQKMNS